MRVAVPPRELAATITARAVLRAGWAVAIVYLAVCAIGVVDLGISNRQPASIMAPLGAVLVMFAALLILIRWPTPGRGVLYLAVGTIAIFAFDYYLLAADPHLNHDGVYLLNRLSIVLLLIGPISSRLIDGVWWCTAGCLLGMGATMAAQSVLGLDVNPGWGPPVALAVYLTIILTVVFIRRSLRRYVPDFSAIEVETARMAGRRELEERAVAIIHDTVLSDLIAVSNAKPVLDDRARARFQRDIDQLSGATLVPGGSA